MDGGKYDKISRPRSTLFGPDETGTHSINSKNTEFLENLQKQISEKVLSINAKQLEFFISIVYSKQTSNRELLLALNILESLFNDVKSLNAQALPVIIQLPSVIANHTNSNVKIIDKASKIMTLIAGLLPRYTSNAIYEKFFGNVATFGRYGKGFDWKISLLDSYAKNADNGLNTIEDTPNNSLIGYIGILAEQHTRFSDEEMKSFQKSAVMLMNKTKFPYKFDKDAFREAIGLIPEVKREKEYTAIINKLSNDDDDKLDDQLETTTLL